MAAEGVAGFYRGAVPVFARAFPANAACFYGYVNPSYKYTLYIHPLHLHLTIFTPMYTRYTVTVYVYTPYIFLTHF
jgi:hypothetical protein